MADPTDPPPPPAQQPWGWTPAEPPAGGPPPWAAPAPPRTMPPGPPYWGQPPVSGDQRPSRNPVPTPAASPRMLRLELGLVLLLAFSPGILGLLLIALGPQGSAEVEAQLVPSAVSASKAFSVGP